MRSHRFKDAWEKLGIRLIPDVDRVGFTIEHVESGVSVKWGPDYRSEVRPEESLAAAINEVREQGEAELGRKSGIEVV